MDLRDKKDRRGKKESRITVRVESEHLRVLQSNNIDVAHLVRTSLEKAVKRLKAQKKGA